MIDLSMNDYSSVNILYVFPRKLHATLLELDKVASGCVDKSEIRASLRFVSSIVRNRCV